MRHFRLRSRESACVSQTRAAFRAPPLRGNFSVCGHVGLRHRNSGPTGATGFSGNPPDVIVRPYEARRKICARLPFKHAAMERTDGGREEEGLTHIQTRNESEASEKIH